MRETGCHLLIYFFVIIQRCGVVDKGFWALYREDVGYKSTSESLRSCCLNMKPARPDEVHCLLRVLAAARQLRPQFCPLGPRLALESIVGWVV